LREMSFLCVWEFQAEYGKMIKKYKEGVEKKPEVRE